MKRVSILIILVIIGVLASLLLENNAIEVSRSSIDQNEPQVSQPIEQKSEQATVIAQNLDTPWSLAFLPDGGMLVTERKGTVRFISKTGELDPKPVATIRSVLESGEGGLMGIAIDPEFSKNNFVYLYYTYSTSGNNTLNRVVRMKYANNQLTDEQTIVDKIPGALFHNGGRIKFGPDKNLYIGTGDAQDPSLAQDKNSLAGKILRVVNGKAEIYSYGHRNVQGIAWSTEGQLWATEHGQSATDELNVVMQGKNYGWPTIRGDQQQSDMIHPRLQSGSETWAPGGLAYFNNSFYFAGLRGQALYEVKLPDPSIRYVRQPELKVLEHFKGEFGRIRDVIIGPDNMLYITTSNHDGRGSPASTDDRIIKIDPSQL